MLKKYLSLLLILSILFCLAGCCCNLSKIFSDDDDDSENTNDREHEKENDKEDKKKDHDDKDSIIEIKEEFICIYQSRNIISEPQFEYL